MKSQRLFIGLFIAALVAPNFACSQNPDRKFVSMEKTDTLVQVAVNDGKYLFRTYGSKIMETSFIPSSQEYISKSHAVVMQPRSNFDSVIESADHIVLQKGSFNVTVQKSPFQVLYSFEGKPIISEKKGYSKNKDGESLEFNLDDREMLYGGGARALGMNRRGNRLPLYNKAHYGYEERSEQLNFSLPIVLSSNKYLIHFDNAPIGYLDFDSKADNTLTYGTISGRKTYQIVIGDSWDELVQNYTQLTGRQPLPPRWAFGNFSSRFGYHSESETRRTIDQYHEKQIPVDAVVLDLYWFGKEVRGSMGNFEFLRDSFPTPKRMIKDFKSKGVHTVLITEPFILTTSKNWDEAVAKDILAKDSIGNPFVFDFFFGNTGLLDIYKPEGEQWFWSVYKRLANMGVSGFWGDLGEPEVHPADLLHATGTADEVHNIYGSDWARLIHEGYQKDFPEQRPFILMRAGYSGAQRFGLIPWSGDVNRTWGGLKPQPEIAVQMGMQGLAYMHSDLGGFAGANPDNELYVRWLQYGVFQPVFRPHAQEDVPPEPVYRDANTMALANAAIKLRYSLLPYNYNLAHKNSVKGSLLMRPLFFEEPDNDSLKNDLSSYFWGEDFLVSPILEANGTEKEIYFPKNSNWFDFFTDKMHEGGRRKSVRLYEEHIPVFVRSGAFVPMTTKSLQNTGEYSGNEITLHYYHDFAISESFDTLFNDDGITPGSFEKGKYELLKFAATFQKKTLTLKFTTEIGPKYIPTEKHINVVVHNIDHKPKRVVKEGNGIDYKWDAKKSTVTFPLVMDTADIIEISLRLNR